MFRTFSWLISLLLVACGPSAGDDDITADDDDSSPQVEGCRAEPQAADRDRAVIVGLPYDEAGGQADTWAALQLSYGGDLTDGGIRFAMGRAGMGEVVFTPDGEVGLVAQEDGSLGAVLLPRDGGEPQVLHTRFSGEFYASAVTVDPSGERAWVVDGNWPENGGGIYEIAIDCDDGTLTETGFVLESKLARKLLLPPSRPDRAVLVATDAPGAEAGDEAFLFPWPEPDEALSGSDAFGDDEAMVCAATLTADDHYALIGDNSVFSGLPNRVAVVEIDGEAVAGVQVLVDLEDPIALLASPFGDAVVAVSGYGNALFVIGPGDEAPFDYLGEPDYDGAPPQLPGGASLLARGPLEGTFAVAENQGVRLARFEGDRTVTDLGLLELGDGYEFITGAIGVQP